MAPIGGPIEMRSDLIMHVSLWGSIYSQKCHGKALDWAEKFYLYSWNSCCWWVPFAFSKFGKLYDASVIKKQQQIWLTWTQCANMHCRKHLDGLTMYYFSSVHALSLYVLIHDFLTSFFFVFLFFSVIFYHLIVTRPDFFSVISVH